VSENDRRRSPHPCPSPVGRGENPRRSLTTGDGEGENDRRQSPHPCPSPVGRGGVSERVAFARSLRKQPTKAEEILWRYLRGSRFHGAKFRRQVPFDRYVVDFYCHATKLVVEIDGKQHDWFADYDARRTAVLEAYGVRVLRLANEDVGGDIDSVLVRIRAALKEPFL
jgi:very-short-patch-repair endonuclease